MTRALNSAGISDPGGCQLDLKKRLVTGSGGEPAKNILVAASLWKRGQSTSDGFDVCCGRGQKLSPRPRRERMVDGI